MEMNKYREKKDRKKEGTKETKIERNSVKTRERKQ